jgi:crotonobetainyl-CoA:carnitine CoA-transferase CaiB-like acyl-CoA transferase
MLKNGVLVPFEGETMLTVDSPIWIEDMAKAPPRLPPELGQHSDEILRGAGYSETEIGLFRAEGVVA